MSGLVSMCLRVAVRKILLDMTMAQGRVFDSPIDPIALLLDQADSSKRPMITVYTQEVGGEPEGRDLGGKKQTVHLIIFAYLTPANVEIDDGLELEAREAGAAMALDILAAQINAALRFGPALWRDVFETAAYRIEKSTARSVLVETEQNIRIPTVEIVLVLESVPEPTFGRELYGVWSKFDAAMRSDAELVGMADFVRSLITSPSTIADWRLTQGEGGYSRAEIRAMGLAPVDDTAADTEDAAALEEVKTSGTTTVTHPGFPP